MTLKPRYIVVSARFAKSSGVYGNTKDGAAPALNTRRLQKSLHETGLRPEAAAITTGTFTCSHLLPLDGVELSLLPSWPLHALQLRRDSLLPMIPVSVYVVS
eukprot:6465679-Amphidinium_carterae.4